MLQRADREPDELVDVPVDELQRQTDDHADAARPQEKNQDKETIRPDCPKDRGVFRWQVPHENPVSIQGVLGDQIENSEDAVDENEELDERPEEDQRHAVGRRMAK